MLELDLTLAILLFVFALFGVLFAEFVVVRRGMDPAAAARVVAIDAWYGVLAALILIVGFSRAIFAAKGWDYYEHNAFFWAKIGTFVAIGVLSVPPTLAYLKWRRTGVSPTDAVLEAMLESRALRAKFAYDAFVSHASLDAKFASLIKRSLKTQDLSSWIDSSDLAFGALLREELQAAIQASRVLVLLWSQAASQSRWVMAEIFTSFHLDRFIIPCVLDETPLPQFLQNTAFLSRKRDEADIGRKLARAIEAAPVTANRVTPWLGVRSQLVQSLIDTIGGLQIGVVLAMSEDFQKAAGANISVANSLKHARNLAPYDPMILNLSGYQRKNDYMFAHWDEIQAGRAPKHPLLSQRERYFFEALCVDPSDANAVRARHNSMGGILRTPGY